MNKNLHYITFQNFPMFSANTIVTMKNLSYLNKRGYDVTLVFPGRGDNKISESEILDFYNIKEKIKIERTRYLLPFGKINIFNKSSFRISHFFWSLIIWIRYFFKEIDKKNTVLITRSNWILYFFSKSKLSIIYECHKFSKLTHLIFRAVKGKGNCAFTFTNELLKDSFQLSALQKKNSIVVHSSYDEEIFKQREYKDRNKNKIIFVGRFTRFNKGRNLDFLIEAFSKKDLNDFELTLIGGPNNIAEQLRGRIKDLSVKNISVIDYLPQNELVEELSTSEIGILINDGRDNHSRLHTSPVKYFEYIRSGLKVLAVDFDSHRALPYSNEISFFNEGDIDSFINELLILSKKNTISYPNIDQYSYEKKIDVLSDLFARLEGFEPPTL